MYSNEEVTERSVNYINIFSDVFTKFSTTADLLFFDRSSWAYNVDSHPTDSICCNAPGPLSGNHQVDSSCV